MNKALIFGASGLTGSELLKLLIELNYYDEVVSFVRKETTPDGPRCRNILSDYNNLSMYVHEFKGADIFCCLGTTIRKVNYNKEAFKKADLYLPLEIAQLGAEFGSKQFLVISSLSANANSNVFYSKIKGEMQEKLKAIKLYSIHVFQPSLLLGERKEYRLGERIGAAVLKGFNIFLSGRLFKYRAIKSYDVAKAMIQVARNYTPGFHIYTSDQIQKIADATSERK